MYIFVGEVRVGWRSYACLLVGKREHEERQTDRQTDRHTQRQTETEREGKGTGEKRKEMEERKKDPSRGPFDVEQWSSEVEKCGWRQEQGGRVEGWELEGEGVAV